MLSLIAEQPDLLACETVPCLTEVRALLELLGEQVSTAAAIPAWISVSCRDGSTLNSGESISELISIVKPKQNLIWAIGINCTPPEHVEELVATLSAALQIPVLVYPNKGEEWDGKEHHWKPGTAATDEEFCSLAKVWIKAGARILGGCCRTTPQTIRMLRHCLSPSA
mmetsp:Transcript_36059/g.56291  ORF Transcript_36059/g.56291 Transcript_36059/m.56291 type:complete len:168 (-) Transcript_36059:250-753(-)